MMLSNPLPQQNSRRDDPEETAEFQWGILGLLASLPFGTEPILVGTTRQNMAIFYSRRAKDSSSSNIIHRFRISPSRDSAANSNRPRIWRLSV